MNNLHLHRIQPLTPFAAHPPHLFGTQHHWVDKCCPSRWRQTSHSCHQVHDEGHSSEKYRVRTVAPIQCSSTLPLAVLTSSRWPVRPRQMHRRASAHTALAQPTLGTILGTITTASGAVAPNILVTVTDQAENISRDYGLTDKETTRPTTSKRYLQHRMQGVSRRGKMLCDGSASRLTLGTDKPELGSCFPNDAGRALRRDCAVLS